jgi:hypothetical protein
MTQTKLFGSLTNDREMLQVLKAETCYVILCWVAVKHHLFRVVEQEFVGQLGESE